MVKRIHTPTIGILLLGLLFLGASSDLRASPNCFGEFRVVAPKILQLHHLVRQSDEPFSTFDLIHQARVNRLKRIIERLDKQNKSNLNEISHQVQIELGAFFFHAQVLSVFTHYHIDSQNDGMRFHRHNFWRAFSKWQALASTAQQDDFAKQVRLELAKVYDTYVELRKMLEDTDRKLLGDVQFFNDSHWQALGNDQLEALRDFVEADIIQHKIDIQKKPAWSKKWLGFLPLSEVWEQWVSSLSRPELIWAVPNPSSMLVRTFLWNGIRSSEHASIVLIDAVFPLDMARRSSPNLPDEGAQQHYEKLRSYFATRGFYFLVNYFRYNPTQPYHLDVLRYAAQQQDDAFLKYLQRAQSLASFYRTTSGTQDPYTGISWLALGIAAGGAASAAASVYAYFDFQASWSEL